jgi:polyisoprenoid-binding protein YceI
MALLLLSACSAPPPAPGSAASRAPPAPGAQRYLIDGERSEVLIWVSRDGPLAELGHNHIIEVADLSGEVWLAPELQRSVFSVRFPVAALRLDEPARRAQQGSGYEETLSEEDVAGTRAHMLDAALLDGANYPEIELDSESISKADSGWIAHAAIRVRAHSAHIDVPVQLESATGQVILSGQFTVTHAALGLVPHSALLGSLRVAQALRIRFHIIARR